MSSAATPRLIVDSRAGKENNKKTALLDMAPSLSFDQTSTINTEAYPPESNNITQFQATWSPSKTEALNPTNLPLSKQPRAWDRKACTPAAEQSRIKKVWKRYELRTQPPHVPNMEGGNEKVVKRARIQDASEGTVPSYQATKWERRRSRGSNRKVPKQASTRIPDEAAKEDKAGTHSLQNKTTPPKDTTQDAMGETLSKQVSESQACDPTSLQDDVHNQDHSLQDAPLWNTHDTTMMEAQSVHCMDMRPEPSIVEPVRDSTNKEVNVREQDALYPAESDELFTLTSVESVSVEVFKTSPERAQQPRSPHLTTNEVADSATTVNPELNSVSTTNMLSPNLAVEHNDQADLQTTQQIPVEEDAAGASATETSCNDDKLPPSTNTAQSGTVDASDDLDSISDELLEQSPLSPGMDDNIFTLIEEACLPTKEAVLNGEDDEGNIQSVEQMVSQAEEAQDDENLHAVTPTKLDTDESPELDMTDVTADFTADFTSQFDDDKDRLKAFILRTRQEKANKAVTITRRESFQNRRDSDAVRRALASPRPALEEKDANASPTREPSLQNISKVLESAISDVEERDVSESNAVAGPEGEDAPTVSPSLRRSTRKQSRIPQLPTAVTAHQRNPTKISVRRTDGNETLILSQEEAKKLAQLTRSNTRKNKGAAVGASTRVAQLTAESLTNVHAASAGLSPATKPKSVTLEEEAEKQKRRKSVHWDEERLTSSRAAPVFSDEANTAAKAAPALAPAQVKKGSARVRRLKGLGAANGTPAKGLLASTLLPDEVAEQNEKEMAEKEKAKGGVPHGKTSKANEKKSRLAPPKKLDLKPSVTSVMGSAVVSEGKENVGRLVSPKKSGAAARGMIPVPKEPAGGNVSVTEPARKRVRKI